MAARSEPLSGPEVIARVRQETDTVLLAFSCGKDSVAAWLAIREHFPRIVPFYLELIPGLEFVDCSLAMYEEWLGCHIIRLPHPSLYRMLNNAVWQPPERLRIIEAARLPNYGYDEVSRLIIEEHELPAATFTLTGVRAADSPNRLSAVRTHGPINWKRRSAWPIWDLKKADLIALFERHRAPLPIDYQWFGRSFDGLDYRFLSVLRREAPADYARILDWFPLAEMEVMRYDTLNA